MAKTIVVGVNERGCDFTTGVEILPAYRIMAGLASGNGCPRDSTAVMSLRGNDLAGWGVGFSLFTSYYLQDSPPTVKDTPRNTR